MNNPKSYLLKPVKWKVCSRILIMYKREIKKKHCVLLLFFCCWYCNTILTHTHRLILLKCPLKSLIGRLVVEWKLTNSARIQLIFLNQYLCEGNETMCTQFSRTIFFKQKVHNTVTKLKEKEDTTSFPAHTAFNVITLPVLCLSAAPHLSSFLWSFCAIDRRSRNVKI